MIYVYLPPIDWNHYPATEKGNIAFGSIDNGASVLYGIKATLSMLRSQIITKEVNQ